MFQLSCFADEISPDLNEEIRFMRENRIRYMELRSVWNKGVLELNDRELDDIGALLKENGIRTASVASPVGKVDIGREFAESLEQFKRAMEVAGKMGAKHVRIFSFYMPREKMDDYETEAVSRIRTMAGMAQSKGLHVYHENEANIFGETSERCLKLAEKVGYPNFGLVFDFSNFVVAGEDVYNVSFQRLKRHIAYLHIKDSLKGSGQIVVAGQGDGCIKEVLGELKNREGLFMAMEPHLKSAGQLRGFSGAELFQKDLDAFRGILNDLGIEII